MTQQQGSNLAEMTPELFAQMVAVASDRQIADAVEAAGTEPVLDRIFQGMQQRFLPEKAKDVDAVVQFVITHDGTQYPYALTIRGGTCDIAAESKDDPKLTITTDVVSFVKLVGGTAQGPQLFMTGKLRVAGDIFFSQRVMGFFDRPRA